MFARYLRGWTKASTLATALTWMTWVPSEAQAQSVAKPSNRGPFTVVVASVPRLTTAEALLARVPSASEALILTAKTPLGSRYRVCIGRFLDRPAAERQRQALLRTFADAWLLALGDTILAGEPKPVVSARIAANSLEGFRAFYREFLPALERMDVRRVQRYLNPALGLWLRYELGGQPVVQQAQSLQELLDLTALESAHARAQLEACLGSYRADTLPLLTEIHLTCGADSAAPQQPVATLLAPSDRRLSYTFAEMKKRVGGMGLSADEARLLDTAEQSLRVRVLRPGASPVGAMYFALVGDRWVLAQLDLICPLK